MRADRLATDRHLGSMPRTHQRRTLLRLATFVTALISMVCLDAVTANGAFANSYTGLLYGGQTYAEVGASSYGANSVVSQESWSAPSGVQFAGFAYTAATFTASNADATGGLSSGFKGSGGNAPTDLNFPFTDDCSVSEATPRTWINNGVQVTSSNRGPGSSLAGDCQTGGSTGGWNYDNSQVESSNTSINPSTTYQTLTLSIWCARDANCSSSDSAEYAVTNLSGDFNDNNNQPSGSVSWNGLSGSWVQTNTGNVSLSASANDPAGVCSMQLNLGGPENLSATVGNTNPGVTNAGGVIGTEFEYGTNPCWVGDTDTGSWTLPAGLPSGSFSASLQASNPGNYQAQGMSASGSPTIASTGSVSIDDQTPTVQLLSPTGTSNWTQNNTATVDVSTGPSGLSALTCTNNGSGDGATLKSSNGDNYVYTVALNPGSNHLSCSAANGDGNGALVGTTGTQLYQQDSTVPSIAFTDGGYTAGTWTPLQQTIQITASGGASGIANLACTLDGNALPDSYGDTDTVEAPAGSSQTAYVTVPANGAHDLQCSGDNAGTPSIVGSGSYQVDVDNQVPLTNFVTESGYAVPSTYSAHPQTASGQSWISGASNVTVGLTSTEATIESGVQTTTCTINGYTAKEVTLTNVPTSGTVAQSTPFPATFKADGSYGWIDGQNKIVCQSDTVAGQVGADGASAGTSTIEYVDVNDPSLPTSPGLGHGSALTPGQCGISSVIDNGGCAYSNGPSQTAWYSSSQTLRIEADDTGAAAPITAITCSGAPMKQSTWTAAADPQDVDGNNGLTVTATITAPGGQINCSASDSATPADTYDLGTYTVSIDPSTPQGAFEPQQYEGAAANIIQLKLADNPSGTQQVSVQATDETTGVLYTGAELTTNPADGHTAYATFDPNTGTWNLTFNPGVFPGVSDKIKFVATATTNAGISGTITTAANGTQEILAPGDLGDNPNAISGYSLTGDNTRITAKAQAGKWVADAASTSSLPTTLNGSSSNPIAPTSVATVATWTHSVCKTAPNKHTKKAAQRSCRTLTSRAPRSQGLPARYAQEEEITGVLLDTTTGAPIAGGSIAIYTTNLATDQVREVHVETTGPRGRFSYRLAAGPNRRVDLIYLGQWGVTHGADSAFDTTTAGELRVHAARVVRVGQIMRITGHILGGSIQANGAIVQMQYSIVGHKGIWAPFKPGRSNAKGGFVIRYPITRGSAGLTYRIRIKTPTQAGWGFRGATSNVLRFRVA